MGEADLRNERLWERGWEGHAREQLLRLARLPLAEKLRWLEEAHRVVRHLQAARDPGDPRCTPAGPAS